MGSKTARSRLEPATFGFSDLPEREAGALLIQTPRLFLRFSAKDDIYGTSVGVPPRVHYSAAVLSRR